MLSRRGLSRSEVVVVLLMLVVLGGLLLVAASRLRESAARMSCQNNLRQLANGVHSYHSAHQALPPLTDQGVIAPTGAGLTSVYWNLSPFLEASVRVYRPGQSPSANYHALSSVPFSYSHKDGSPGTQFGGDANQVWRLFIDPSDTTAHQLRDVPMTLPDSTTGYYATGSYAANGLLPWGSAGGPKRLSEWPAELILFAERPQVCRTAAGETVYNLWGVGFYSPHMPAFATQTPTNPPGLWATGQIVSSADGHNPIQLIAKNRPCDPRLPGSPHHSGMQVAMIDGNVRSFGSDTDPQVFWAACAPFGQPIVRENGR
jgi:hypothetical protein